MVMDPSEHISRIAADVDDVALHWPIAMSKNASARSSFLCGIDFPSPCRAKNSATAVTPRRLLSASLSSFTKELRPSL
eukprot:15813250-Heterocapsa_arctica.AAC.1